MKVLSYRSGGKWLETNPPSDDDEAVKMPDPALNEIRRVFSDCFRCNNLVVLTGLGTSLYVNVDNNIYARFGKRSALNGKQIAPTMQDLWSKAEKIAGENFDKIKALSKLSKAAEGNIEALLSYCKVASEFLEDENRTVIDDFIIQAEKMIRDEVRFVTSGNDVTIHSELLKRLARRSNRKIRSKIFTTNYDLCFEYAARQGRYVVIDGFSHTTPQIFDSIYFGYDIVKRENNPDSHDFIRNVFHLYKLHGSIDWIRNKKNNEIEKDPTTENPVLVYPRNTKYELAFEQPYIEMMAAFQAAIRQPDTGLLVIGFGFNDNHIAEPILSAIQSNLNLKVVVCDPMLAPLKQSEDGQHDKPGTAETNPHIRKIRYLIEQRDARLALINGTFERVVPELPDIAAQTDLEQHMERVRMLREQGNE